MSVENEAERASRMRKEDLNEAFFFSADEYAAKLGLQRGPDGEFSAADEAAIRAEIARVYDLSPTL